MLRSLLKGEFNPYFEWKKKDENYPTLIIVSKISNKIILVLLSVIRLRFCSRTRTPYALRYSLLGNYFLGVTHYFQPTFSGVFNSYISHFVAVYINAVRHIFDSTTLLFFITMWISISNEQLFYNYIYICILFSHGLLHFCFFFFSFSTFVVN